MKRRMFVTTTASLGTALLAGCSGGDGSGSNDDGSSGSSTDDSGTGVGSFRLLISDQPAAIEDFDSLDVTLSSARVFQAGDDEEVTPATVTRYRNVRVRPGRNGVPGGGRPQGDCPARFRRPTAAVTPARRWRRSRSTPRRCRQWRVRRRGQSPCPRQRRRGPPAATGRPVRATR